MSITIKHVNQPFAPADGYRVLVERLWPRDLKKDDVVLDAWAKELAPSVALSHWFDHAPSRWDGFRHRYARELDDLVEHWRPLAERSTRHTVTLLYAASDDEHNHALVLATYLARWLHSHGPR